MSFLLQRRSKTVVPTPDPPVKQKVPESGVIEASVLVVPPDGSVHETGMKYAEFNVEGLSQMVLHQDQLFGVVQVARCNSNALIIADIVAVPVKDVEQIEPETWYLPLGHAWRFPIVDSDRATLLARSIVEVQHHGFMQPDKNYSGFSYQLLEGHRIFLVVHWIIGPYSQNMRIALNIYAYMCYRKPWRP